MRDDLVEKIARKASNLPAEAQRKALDYVESLEREEMSEKKPFRSVPGPLAHRNVQASEDDPRVSAMCEAMSDELFIADLAETMDDFKYIDRE